MIEVVLELQGLPCPLPLIKLKKALAETNSDVDIRILATDKGVLKDVPAFCQHNQLDCEVISVSSPYELVVSKSL